MRRRSTDSTLPPGAVAPVVESGPPAQARSGEVDLNPILRDPGTSAAAGRGELDPFLRELHQMARSREDSTLAHALAMRARAIGLDLEKV